MQTLDLSIWDMIFMFAVLAAPITMLWFFRLGMAKDAILAAGRMTVQLILIGLYLKYIFKLNSLWLNLLWMLVMVTAANYTILQRAGLVKRKFFALTFAGTAFVTASVTGILVTVISPSPIYSAQYLIPIFGMILGNCMKSNVLSIERFYCGIAERKNEFITRLMLGASHKEAVEPFLKQALRSAINPHVATMATMGLVALPGMMTGQILGGAVPITAIKYQLAIMICIFTTMVFGTWLNLLLSMKVAFDEYGIIKQNIFAKKS